MKTLIRFLLAIALTAISFTACTDNEPTLDERKQVETVVTPEMLYGTWTLTEMYSVYFIGEDSIVTRINYGTAPDTTIHYVICDTITFIHDSIEDYYDAILTTYINDNGIITLSKFNDGDNLTIVNNHIEWDYLYREDINTMTEAKISIVNNKLWMNTEIIGNRYIFSVFTKQ